MPLFNSKIDVQRYAIIQYIQDNYRDVDVPVWAMKLILDEDDFEKPDR